jgi:hypothetical protein
MKVVHKVVHKKDRVGEALSLRLCGIPKSSIPVAGSKREAEMLLFFVFIYPAE